MNRPLRVFVIAGEPSGDLLGGALMAGMSGLESVEWSGVGGPQMLAQGLTSLFPMADLSVMGLLEVLPRVPKLLARVKQTVQGIVDFAPDVLITIDSPDFCLRVARRVRERKPGLRIVHYVAPSVWAWRPERAAKMARHVDHVLAILPFEPPFMEAAGMSCDFVGHPAVSKTVADMSTQRDLAAELGLNLAKDKIICLLPGSRVGEIARMAPVYGEVARRIAQEMPNARFVLPVSGAVVREVRKICARWEVQPILLDPTGFGVEQGEARKRAVFQMSHGALATSGTVVLELAGAACPMVVAYKANYLTTRMVKKLARIDTANLINIVTGSRVVPEFLFENCTPDKITPALLALLSQAGTRDDQLAAGRETMLALGAGQEDPGLRAARSVLGFLG